MSKNKTLGGIHMRFYSISLGATVARRRNIFGQPIQPFFFLLQSKRKKKGNGGEFKLNATNVWPLRDLKICYFLES